MPEEIEYVPVQNYVAVYKDKVLYRCEATSDQEAVQKIAAYFSDRPRLAFLWVSGGSEILIETAFGYKERGRR